MLLQEVEELLDKFLNANKNQEVYSKLKRFEKDDFLLNFLKSKLANKDLRQYKPDEFLPVIQVLDSIVCADIPSEVVTNFQPLYRDAIRTGSFKVYQTLLGHLNSIKDIHESLLEIGVKPNPNYGNRDQRNLVDDRFCLYDQNSYLTFIQSLLNESKEVKDINMCPLDDRLTSVENHLREISKHFDVAQLFKAGYVSILINSDKIHNQKSENNINVTFGILIGLLKKLDSRGFDIYNDKNMGILADYTSKCKLSETCTLADYLTKEAFMYATNMHLKRD